MPPPGPQPVHYLPLATTLLAAVFASLLLRRRLRKGRGAHLLWWSAGIACYGLGTALESAITVLGNSVGLTKAWYIAGALLGGYPLAQGSLYFLAPRPLANRLTAATLPLLAILSLLVLLSPANLAALEPHRPSGAVLGWSWLRAFTPILNLYAATFLIGGAAVSALRAFRGAGPRGLAIGNGAIALGALLPGVGGGMAKAGLVEALYVGEFVGLLLIWWGYAACVRAREEFSTAIATGRRGGSAVTGASPA